MDEQAVPHSGCGSPRWLCGRPTVALVTDRYLILQVAGIRQGIPDEGKILRVTALPNQGQIESSLDPGSM